MNRLDHHSQRLNDVFFAVVLAAAGACAGWIAAAQAVPGAAPVAHVVELERVVVVGQREAAPGTVAAATIVLPRVVITGKRIDEAAVARAASRDRNG